MVISNESRDYSDIHASSDRLCSKETIDLRMLSRDGYSNIISATCCSYVNAYKTLSSDFVPSTKRKLKSRQVNNCVIYLNKDNIPGKMRTKEFLKEYLDFLNKIFEGYFLFSLIYINDSFCDDVPIIYKSLTKVPNTKNRILIGFNYIRTKKFSNFNLAGLTVIRYLQFAPYWYYVWETIRLRNLEELKHLTNFEIFQLACYCDISGRFYSNVSLYSFKNLFQCEYYPFKIHKDIKKSIECIFKGSLIHSAFTYAITSPNKICVSHYKLSYIKSLYHKKQYLEIYKLLTEENNVKYIDMNLKGQVIFKLENGKHITNTETNRMTLYRSDIKEFEPYTYLNY